MQLRPHHAYCIHFMSLSYPERGADYEGARDRIEQALLEGTGDIELVDEPDILCQGCPYYDGDGCAHPEGDETVVKKWDRAIRKALGLESGLALSVSELEAMVKEKYPLPFCTERCPYCRSGECNPGVVRGVFG